ncbi:MAG: RbcX chaperonin protein [Cyanobacteria bacterium]|nr:RbcX chaperonin protein [Cyanobacteria bacterium CG_2015-16_32_12]NCO79193.1 RbcX chaperonin protein [Cyanobacteria bacterium CG_2015-22_32_23]NCQ04935.1 RbcX chaperonin protein [Cyanobacteria bacterium CG_2015-09_32_10]NCQ41272.1 RbcX chaperonin protein [Cyanobacteria bacterium CG_2015-04_32_10]NCS84686.1 RbcX chaperonin protein [Cyanobacteria bacterium CG_2015-02_32_10]
MTYKQVVKDTAKVLQSYLTYQAVRVIIEQLSETNPGQAIWLSDYSDQKKVQDSDTYISELIKENKELVLRILTVREDLAEQVLEFLPEMVKTNINQSNMEHRRHLLERLTQTQSSSLMSSPVDETNFKSNQSENKEE